MLKALLHNQEPGRICEVVQPGQEFEVHENFQWVDVPDDTTHLDRWDTTNNVVIKFDPLTVPGFAENAYLVARGIGYGSLGNQLDMLYHELAANGNISTSGVWFQHITKVKSDIPKDDPAKVHQWNLDYAAAQTANSSPS
jgi:hypothetical protein